MGRSDRFRQHKEGIYGGIAEEINAKRPDNDKASTSGSTITSNVHQRRAPVPQIIPHYEQAEMSTDRAAGWAKPLRDVAGPVPPPLRPPLLLQPAPLICS